MVSTASEWIFRTRTRSHSWTELVLFETEKQKQNNINNECQQRYRWQCQHPQNCYWHWQLSLTCECLATAAHRFDEERSLRRRPAHRLQTIISALFTSKHHLQETYNVCVWYVLSIYWTRSGFVTSGARRAAVIFSPRRFSRRTVCGIDSPTMQLLSIYFKC